MKKIEPFKDLEFELGNQDEELIQFLDTVYKKMKSKDLTKEDANKFEEEYKTKFLGSYESPRYMSGLSIMNSALSMEERWIQKFENFIQYLKEIGYDKALLKFFINDLK
ncbi:hypothetical protein [Elizabethkingia miricola]|uniref:hypothetical protein n=1 Tax=Elizabethkingia miricola TaxID=172045 RepID=UPI00099AEE43|nr:hypothetical protein [Elizabethkingia miricola]OPC06808.1 hypothetical protein BAY01_18470 [Elizabethkingia miricola]